MPQRDITCDAISGWQLCIDSRFCEKAPHPQDVGFVSLDVAARHHLRRNFWMTAIVHSMSRRDISCDAMLGCQFNSGHYRPPDPAAVGKGADGLSIMAARLEFHIGDSPDIVKLIEEWEIKWLFSA
jgi:hypothetical protein